MSSYILNIENSHSNCSVCTTKDDTMISLIEEDNGDFISDVKLDYFIDLSLKGANITLSDLDAICISSGPGSFTGLRVSSSIVKGLCFGLKIPMMAINTLDIISNGNLEVNKYYFVVLKAYSDKFYFTVKNGYNNLNKSQILIGNLNDINNYIYNLNINKDNIVFISNDVYLKSLIKYEFIFFTLSSLLMVKLSYKKFLNMEFEDINFFQPLYI